MAYAVGIDLGTTNTVVAVVDDGVVSTLTDSEHARLLPSVVSFHSSGSVLVGRRAVERRLLDPVNTIYSVKRLIGRSWGSPEVQQAREKLPFELREGPHGGTVISARGETFSLPEISAFVLRQAKAIAEAALGEPVERAVITVPANFNDLQRAATKVAGKLAGLEVLRILNEPTAAALAYGSDGKPRERVAVYDFGGGTFDVTVLDLASSVFEVLATAGDSALGGDDLDVVVADRMADDLLKKHRYDVRTNPTVFGRLRLLGEKMKRELSTSEEYELAVDDVVPGEPGASITWRFRMTRAELEWASLALVERSFDVCQRALEAAGIGPGDLDRVILVGGVTRMPMVARKVEQFFGRPPMIRINPDEVVALGAAIQAGLLDRSRARVAGAALQPKINEASVIQPPPVDTSEPDLPLDLPLVRGGGPRAPLPAPFGGATLGRGRARPPSPHPVPKSEPRETAGGRAAEVVARPEEFLTGGGSKPLVFDVPEPSAPSLDVRKADRRKDGSVARDLGSAPQLPPLERSPSTPPPFEREPSRAAPSPPLELELDHASSPARGPRLPSLPAVELRRKGTPGLPAAPSVAHKEPSVAKTPPRGPSLKPPGGSSMRPKAPLLIDVTPLSLSVETVGEYCDVLIDANTPVPCDRTRTFTTASDGQTSVRVRVAQGESRRFSENTFLGELELTGIAPAGRGQAKIAVTFEIDVDGILNVRARDEKTGHETKARIQLVGAQNEPADLDAMRARQVAHPIDVAARARSVAPPRG